MSLRTREKRNQKLQHFLFFVVISLNTSPLLAACGLSLVVDDISATWDPSWTTQAVAMTVTKSNPSECTFGLGFSQGGAGSYTRYASQGGLQLRYQLYKDSAVNKVLKDVPDLTSENDVVMVTLPAGSNPQIVQFYLDIPFASATVPTLAAAGTFTDTFTINAYEGATYANLASPPELSKQVNLSINVPKMISIALVDTGGVFQDSATSKSINFGTLQSGQVSRFDLRLRTNAGFSVTTSSTNLGKLKHTGSTSTVPYQLSVNNVAADLTGVVPVLSGSGQTSYNGLGYPVKIVIGSVGASALAGPYQDTVVITATTTE